MKKVKTTAKRIASKVGQKSKATVRGTKKSKVTEYTGCNSPHGCAGKFKANGTPAPVDAVPDRIVNE